MSEKGPYQMPTRGITMRNRFGVLALLGYIGTIVAANVFINHVGSPPPPHVLAPHTLPVWPNLPAPSGVYLVGLALVLRNVVQRQFGRGTAVVAILTGGAISWLAAGPGLAFASSAAFLCSEGLDMGIYTPLRGWFERHGLRNDAGLALAVLPASLAGGAVDSALFLWLAPHIGESFWLAQFVGKTWGVLAAVAVLSAVPLITRRATGTPELVPA